MAVSGHVREWSALAQHSSLVLVGNEVEQVSFPARPDTATGIFSPGTEVLDRSGQGQSDATWLDLFPFTVSWSASDSFASPGQSSKDLCILGTGEVVSRSFQHF